MVADALCMLSCEKTYAEFSVQVNTMQVHTICDYIDSDAKLNSLTGLHSFKLLELIEELVQKIYRVCRVRLRERLILTFMKLKTSIAYVILAVLFGNTSSQTCKNVFFEILSVLSVALKPAISIPTRQEIKCNLPKCFEMFQNVVLVLDCTELKVQLPKCLCCRVKCYSHYKGGTTIKFMT